MQKDTGGNVKAAFADQGYTGAQPSEEAAKQGDTLEIVKRSEAKKDFVLLPKRWVVERASAGRHAFAA
jgi:transposase